VKELNRLGWRVATHAVGDAAIDEVLAAYEAADAEKSIVGRRWTIEHGFHSASRFISRMKKLASSSPRRIISISPDRAS